jgi:hypothetical protein
VPPALQAAGTRGTPWETCPFSLGIQPAQHVPPWNRHEGRVSHAPPPMSPKTEGVYLRREVQYRDEHPLRHHGYFSRGHLRIAGGMKISHNHGRLFHVHIQIREPFISRISSQYLVRQYNGRTSLQGKGEPPESTPMITVGGTRRDIWQP